MKTAKQWADVVWAEIDTFTRESFDKFVADRDREVRAAALRDACAKVEQWFSIASRAPSFDSWAAMRRALSEMVYKMERGE